MLLMYRIARLLDEQDQARVHDEVDRHSIPRDVKTVELAQRLDRQPGLRDPVQRPASVGVELYQRSERDAPQAVCPRCGTEFVGQMWFDDLKEVVGQLGFDYRMGDGRTLQDYCPRCKRVMRGLSYVTLPRPESDLFYGSRVDDGHPTGTETSADAQARKE